MTPTPRTSTRFARGNQAAAKPAGERRVVLSQQRVAPRTLEILRAHAARPGPGGRPQGMGRAIDALAAADQSR